jgi:hypothetical protein
MIVQTVYDVNRSMEKPTSQKLPISYRPIYVFAIALSVTVTGLAVAAWGSMSGWHFQHLSVYRVFPLFGLLAFSWLWAQYVVLAVMYARSVPGAVLKPYFRYSGYGVLVAILLHPSLLIGQLWHDGFGLPPGSYGHFVNPRLEWVVVLGMLSLLIFLAYELHRWFGARSWWRFVFYASDVAMLAVFYHGLRLGDELMNGWYRSVWLLYGIILIAALLYIRTRKPLSAPRE